MRAGSRRGWAADARCQRAQRRVGAAKRRESGPKLLGYGVVLRMQEPLSIFARHGASSFRPRWAIPEKAIAGFQGRKKVTMDKS